MDIFGALRHLLGVDSAPAQQKKQPIPQPAPAPPQLAASNGVQGNTVNGYTPEPGYFNQAIKYNNNPMDPSVSRIDPKYFGYPADVAVKVNGYTPKPGYYNAAVKYNDAFNRGDYNSPDIIGQDPANFGYPADTSTRAPQVQKLGLQDILKRNRF